MSLTGLQIITQNCRLTSMQMAALRARVNAPSHAQAARNMRMSRQRFGQRIARAMASMCYPTRNAVRDLFPQYPSRRDAIMVASLDAAQ